MQLKTAKPRVGAVAPLKSTLQLGRSSLYPPMRAGVGAHRGEHLEGSVLPLTGLVKDFL